MRTFERVLLALATVLVVLVAVAYALPSRYAVVRSIDIDAPPSKIDPLVADTRAWKSWSAWNQRDPQMEITYAGPQSGAGAQWRWKSRSEGAGEMTLTDVEPDRRIGYALYFPDMDTRASGAITFDVTTATTTRVTWTNEGELGNNPAMRWMGLAMDRLVGTDFATGLANLKAVATR